MKRFTYNAVYDAHGENAMIAYEAIVGNLLDTSLSFPESTLVLDLAEATDVATARALVDQAVKHANQERQDSFNHDLNWVLGK